MQNVTKYAKKLLNMQKITKYVKVTKHVKPFKKHACFTEAIKVTDIIKILSCNYCCISIEATVALSSSARCLFEADNVSSSVTLQFVL
jgi:hypothetical protein